MDAQPPSPRSQSSVVNYRIRREAAVWRLDRGGDRLAAFASAAEAVAEACHAAKADAEAGRVAIITVDTVPQELHCYVPLKVDAPRSSDLPDYLRLVVSR